MGALPCLPVLLSQPGIKPIRQILLSKSRASRFSVKMNAQVILPGAAVTLKTEPRAVRRPFRRWPPCIAKRRLTPQQAFASAPHQRPVRRRFLRVRCVGGRPAFPCVGTLRLSQARGDDPRRKAYPPKERSSPLTKRG